MCKLVCFCALSTLLCFSVREVENCEKVRCTGPVDLIGSQEQGLSPGEVDEGPMGGEGMEQSKYRGKGQRIKKGRCSSK